jgi:hypothetical protein
MKTKVKLRTEILMLPTMTITPLWNAGKSGRCSLSSGKSLLPARLGYKTSFLPEDGGSRFLRNIGKFHTIRLHIPDDNSYCPFCITF